MFRGASSVGGLVGKVLLRPPLLYGVARRSVSRGRVELPGQDEARRVLEAASPRPGRDVPCLSECQWPSEPLFDVTVIIPCYNVERYVNECVVSVLGQKTSRTFEVLVIDDGSTDASGQILDKLAERDDRVRVVHQQNKGFSGARNRGIDLARGAKLMFVDSDDVVEFDAIEALSDAYDGSSCDYVTATYSRMDTTGSRVCPVRGIRTHGAPWARLYSREVWRDIRFPEGFWFEDTLQAYCVMSRFVEEYLDKSVYRYRAQPNSISATCSRHKKGLDSFWIVEEMLLWCERLGISLGQELYDQTIRQLGPLLYRRTLALSEDERKALFVASCDLLNGRAEWDFLETTLGGRWRDVEKAIRNGNYGLWRLAVSSM